MDKGFRFFKHTVLRVITGVVALFFLFPFFIQNPTVANAAPNQEINYQGKLTNDSNVAVPDGVYHMRFWLLTSPTAATTTAVWSEDRSAAAGDRVTVRNGLFSVMLGSSTPLSGVDFNQTLYLGVEVGGSAGSPSWDGEMSPRKVLGSVPAAFESDKLDGLDSTQFLRSDAPTTLSTTTASTLLTLTQNGTGNILDIFDGSNKVFTILDGGAVGIASATPSASYKLSVGGDSYFAGNLTATGTLALLGTGTSTAQNGFNIATGCYAINNVCLTSNSGLATTSIDTSAKLAAIVSDETGTGALVFGTNATLASTTFTGFTTLQDATSTTFFAAVASSTNLFASNAYFGSQVGIASSSPSATLSVGGNIAANQLSVMTPDALTYFDTDILSVRGTNNIFVGSNAAYRSSTTGQANVAIGTDALFANVSPTSTVAIGYQAGVGNYLPYSNVGGVLIGESAGFNLADGSNYNTLIGYASGYNITSGAYNIVLGQGVNAPLASGNGQLNIGNLIYGTNLYNGASNSSTPVDGGAVGIGTSSPFAKLSINARAGDTFTSLFAIGSSTASGTSTLFEISNTGSTTAQNGFNIATGCFAINGNCTGRVADGVAGQLAYYAADGSVVTGTSTFAGNTIGANNIAGTLTTTGTLVIGDGGDRIDIDSNTWDVTNGTITGATWNGGVISTLYGGTGNSATPGMGELLIGSGLGFDLATLTEGNSISITNLAGSITIACDAASPSQSGCISASDYTAFGNGLATSSIDTSAKVAAIVSDETGTGILVFNTNPTFVGNVGIGTTSPYAKLSVHANAGDTNTTLFAIASSTASATSTLLTVRNTGETIFSDGLNRSLKIDFSNQNALGTVQLTASDDVGGIETISMTSNNVIFHSNSKDTVTIAENAAEAGVIVRGGGVFGWSANPDRSGNDADTMLWRQAAGVVAVGTTAFDADATLVAGRIGIGTTSPYANLSIHADASATNTTLFAIASSTADSTTTLFAISNEGVIAINNAGLDTTGATTTILRLNGQTFLSGSDDSGSGSNIFLGYRAGADSDSSYYNVGIGFESLKYVTGGGNAALGYKALSFNGEGHDNAAFGYNSLGNNTTGFNNVAVGSDASVQNISATNTVAVGAFSGGGGEFSSSISAQGYTVIGSYAGYSFDSGADYNTLVGYQSGSNITSGYGNILIGASVADNNLTSGHGNVGLGNELFFASASANNQLNIGNFLFGTLPATSTAFRLPTTGNLGIASTSPTALLSLHANAGSAYKNLFEIGSSTASATTTLFSVSNTGEAFLQGQQSDLQLLTNNEGNRGIAQIVSTVGGTTAIGLNQNTILFWGNGKNTVTLGENMSQPGLIVRNGSILGWSSNSLNAGNSADTMFSREGAGILALGTDSGLADGTLLLGNIGASGVITSTSTSATSTLPWLTATRLAVTGPLYAGATGAGTNGFVLQTTGSGVQWVATSSLGLGGSGGSNWTDNGAYLSPLTSTDGILAMGSSTIGGGTQQTGLTINGGATTTGFAYFATNVASDVLHFFSGPSRNNFADDSGGMAGAENVFAQKNSVNRYVALTGAGEVSIDGLTAGGILGQAESTNTTGTTSLIVGVNGIAAQVGAGAVTTVHGIEAVVFSEDGFVSNAAGVYIKSAGFASANNNYGLYIDDQSASGANNNWNLYSAGTGPNYFGGRVGIGTTSPTNQLDVNGIASVLTALNVGAVTSTGGATVNINTANDNTQMLALVSTSANNFTFYETMNDTTYSGLAAKNFTFKSSSASSDVVFAPSTLAPYGWVLKASGNAGVGSSSPFAKLSIQANAADTNTTLFAIGSSTASATSTIFSINNIGRMTGDSAVFTGNGLFDPIITMGDPTNQTSGDYNAIRMYQHDGGNGSANIEFYGNGNDSKFRLTNSGTAFQIFDDQVDAANALFTIAGNDAANLSANFGSSNGVIGVPINIYKSGQSETVTGLSLNNNQTGAGSNITIDFGSINNNGDSTTTARIIGVKENGSVNNIDAGFVFTSLRSGLLTEQMRIMSSGNVGIGSSSPYGVLSVDQQNSDAGTALLALRGKSGQTGNFIDAYDDSGNSRFAVSKDGVVNGSVFNGTAAYFQGSAPGSVGQSMFAIAGVYGGGGIGDLFQVATDSQSGVVTDVINNKGYFGIGTSSPSAPLSLHAIAGAVGQRDLFLIASSTANATTTLFSVSNTGAVSFASGNASISASGVLTVASCTGCGTGGGGSDPFPGNATSTLLTFNGGLNVGPNGTYKLNGQDVLTGSTTLYSFFGGGAGNTSFTGDSNTGFGNGSLANLATAGGNTAVGESALGHLTDGLGNVAIGATALYAATTSIGQIAIGSQALANSTSGFGNIAIGYWAMNSNDDGGGNLAIGDHALFGNVSGSYNTVVGNSAMEDSVSGFFNAVFGNGSLGSNLTGGSNTVIGYSALSNATSSSNNIALGFSAGDNITSGSGNIIIGTNVDAPIATGDRQLNIGNLIYGTNIHTGGSSATPVNDGKVGIGTSSPFAKLSVHANVGETNTALFAIGSSTSATTTTLFGIDNIGNTYIAGALGVGVNNPLVKFYVSGGQSRFENGGVNMDSVQIEFGSPVAPSAYLQKISTSHSNTTLANNSISFALSDIAGVTQQPNVIFRGNNTSGFGTSSPFATLAVQANAGDANKTLFAIGSSTASATTTLFSVSNTGSTTAANGFNITAGCYAINGTCLTTGGASLTGSTGQVAYFSGSNTAVGTSSLFIASNSNIGIGTTSPTSPLTVAGLGQFTATNNTANSSTWFWGQSPNLSLMNYSDTANSVAGLQFLNGSDQNAVSGIAGIEESTSLGALGFFTGGSGRGDTVPERMRITSAGNVGIGTTSPKARLAVDTTLTGTTGTQFGANLETILSPSADQTIGSWGSSPNTRGLYSSVYVPQSSTHAINIVHSGIFDTENYGSGDFGYLVGSESFAFNGSDVTGFGIRGAAFGAENDDGVLGELVGMTAWTGVYGGTTTNQIALMVQSDIGGGSVTNRYGIFLQTTSGSATNDYGIYQQSTQNNFFAGNIGIGTTSPYGTLSLQSSSDIPTLVARASGGQTANLASFLTSGGSPLMEVTGDSTITDSTKGILTLWDNGVAKSGDGAILSVHADDQSPFLAKFYDQTFSATDPVFTYFAFNDGTFVQTTAGQQQFAVGGDYTNVKMVVDANGNVGIGTTTPRSLFSIGDTNGINFSTATSTFNSTGGINIRNGCYAINGACIGTSASVSMGSAITGGSDGSVLFVDSGALAQDNTNFHWDNTFKYLGIGTNAPQALVHVNGGSYNTSFLATSGDTIGPSLMLSNTGAGGHSFAWVSTGSDSDAGAGSLIVYHETNGTLPLVISPGDKVGVGTTSPFAKLSVQANDGETNTMLFAVGSTTGTVNSTLLSVSNTGVVSMADGGTFVDADGNFNLLGSREMIFNTNGSMEYIDTFAPNNNEGTILLENASNEYVTLYSHGAAPINFYTNSAERMRISDTGNIGVGTTSPFSKFSIQANAGETNKNLFEIGSSTASATTTLFSVSNIGLLTLVDNTAATTSIIRFGTGTLLSASANSLTLGTNAGRYIQASGATRNTIIGQNALTLATSSSQNTAVGYSTLSAVRSGNANFNSAFGSFALTNLTSGSSNTALGQNTGSNLTTGGNNIAIGTSALGDTASGGTGSYNIGIGTSALGAIQAGFSNVAVGSSAGSLITDGQYNMIFGESALQSVTTGSNNVALGYSALNKLGQSNGAGSDNVAVGYLAGNSLDTLGHGNLFLGSRSGSNLTQGSGNVAVGTNTYFPSATANNQLNIGNFLYGTLPATSTAFRLPTTGNLGIASTSPTALLSLHANAGSAYKNLFEIGSSTASATTTLFSVSNTGVASTTNLVISALGGTGSVGSCLTGGLTGAIATTSCGGGSLTGSTGQVAYFTGSGIAAGTSSLTIATNGKVGVGSTTPAAKFAIQSIPSDSGTTTFLIGSSTGSGGGSAFSKLFEVSNVGNVSIAGTLATYGSAVPGMSAMFFSPCQFCNAQIGIQRGDNSQAALLEFYPNGPQTASNPEWLMGMTGNQSSYSFSYWEGSTVYNVMNITNNNTAGAGLVGIGTTTPTGKLSIHTSASDTGTSLFNIGSTTGSVTTTLFNVDNAGIVTMGDTNSTASAMLQFGTNNNAWTTGYDSTTKSFRIASSTSLSSNVAFLISHSTSSSYVGIGTTTPTALFSVAGSVAFSTTLDQGTTGQYICIDSAGTFKLSRGNTCTASSMKYKDHIEDLKYGLDDVMKMRPVSFQYLPSMNAGTSTRLGFVAEEIASITPEIVTHDDKGEIFGLDYVMFTSVLAKAIQEENMNMEAIAGTTTTTEKSDAFAQRFFDNMYAKLTTWLADAGNNIGSVFVGGLHARDEICVDDQCLTRDDIRALIEMKNGGGAAPAPSPTPDPTPEPTPTVDPGTDTTAPPPDTSTPSPDTTDSSGTDTPPADTTVADTPSDDAPAPDTGSTDPAPTATEPTPDPAPSTP